MCSVHGLAVSLGPALSHSAITFCKQNTTIWIVGKTSRLKAVSQLLQSLRHSGVRAQRSSQYRNGAVLVATALITVYFYSICMLDKLRFEKNTAAVALVFPAQNHLISER